MRNSIYTFIIMCFCLASWSSVAAQSQLTIDLKELDPVPDPTVTGVDVYISNFQDFLTMQFAILWDSEVLEISHVTNLSQELPGFNESYISLPSQTNQEGVLRLSYSSSNASVVSLPDDHRLFTLVFTKVGEPCDETDVKVGDAYPIFVEFIDGDFNEVPLHSNNITVSIPGSGCGSSGSLSCKDVLDLNVQPWHCGNTIEVEDIIGNHVYDMAEVTPSELTIDHLNVPVDVTTVVTLNGETKTCLTKVTLVDRQPPIAVVESHITVALSSSGNEPPTAKLFVESVDNGSYDQCSAVTLSPAFWEFDCSHIGDHTIVTEVMDESGNINKAWTTVTVEYKLTGTPILQCPDDVVVACSVDIFDQTAIENIVGNASVDFGCAPIHHTLFDYDENGDGDLHDTFTFDGIEVSERFNKACNFGPAIRTWKIPGTSISCQQLIVIKESAPFDGLSQIDWPYSKDAFTAVASNDGAEACNNTTTFPGNIYSPDDITLVPDTGIPDYAEINLLCEEDFCQEPAWDETTCALLGYSLETTIFQFEGGACRKIINDYTVIDWCSYDPNVSADEGIWTWTVIGYINDETAPELETESGIIEECANPLKLSATATDITTDITGTTLAYSCPSGQISWRVYVDFDADGTYDREWNSFVPEDANTNIDPLWSDDNEADNIAEFGYGIPDVRVGNKGDVDNAHGPTTRSGQEYTIHIDEYLTANPGTGHYVLWIASDACGNEVEIRDFFTLEGANDHIDPVPYCINLSTAILTSTSPNEPPSIELFAIDFNAGSYDNCTKEEKLRYTFTDTPPSQDPAYNDALRSSSRIFTEADLNSTASGFISLKVYVWDESDNNDYCVVQLRLKSPDDPCTVTNIKCDRLTASLDANAQLEIWVDDLNVTYDNPCGIANIDLSFSSFHNNVQNLKLDCDELGYYNYEVFIFQNNQQTSSCKNTITVIDPFNLCTNSGQEVVLKFETHYGAKGTNVCLPFKSDFFHGVEAFQGSVSWNADVLSYTGTSSYQLPGLTPASFATQNTANGELGFLWFDQTGVTPVTLANGSTLFEVCFDVIGEDGDVSYLKPGDSPVPTQVSHNGGEINHVSQFGEFIVGVNPCDANLDDEKPIPYCLAGLTAYLSHTSGSGNTDPTVEVWAIDFDAGSTDNCTPQSELRFSFSDTNPTADPEFVAGSRSSSRIFTEADITGPNNPISLKVYVWDNADNKDFCSVSLTIKDVTEDPCLNNTEDNIQWPKDVIELSESNVNLNDISQQFSIDNLVMFYGFTKPEVEPTFINTPCTDGLVYAYDDTVLLTGGYTFKILRQFTVLDWYTGNVYTYVQIIKNIDPSDNICDFLPNTAPIGDCASGHTLDDDVEWPADIAFADHRITPAELVIFSSIPEKDAQPIFYHANAGLYSATYVDLLNSLSTEELVIGRQWTVTRSDSPNLSWSYEQLLTIDITVFSNLVTVNTINNRPIPNVQITNSVATDLNGSAIVVGNDVLEPKLQDEEINGLDLRDLVLVQNHILGQTILSDLQLKAGDMNNDQSVTTLDLVLTMGTMIGQNVGYSQEWRFLDYTNNTPLGATPKGHYIGVKPGDVDDSAQFTPENPQMEDTDLFITDQLLNNGESYVVPMTLENAIDAWGVHLNIEYDPEVMQILDIYSDHFNGNLMWHEAASGEISAIAVSPTGLAQSIDNTSSTGNTLVYVEFMALKNDVIGDKLKLSEDKLSYVLMDDFTSRRFAGNLDGEITVNTIDIDGKVHVSVYPNPAIDNLIFELSGPLSGENFDIEIYDVRGQKLLNYSNSNVVDVRSLVPGMYIYKMYINDKIIADRFMVTR